MLGRQRYDHVLAIYPNARGFGFVLFEGPQSPLYWAIVEVRGKAKNSQCLRRLSAMLDKWTPDVLVLQDISIEEGGTRRGPRVRRLNGAIASLAEKKGIAVSAYSRAATRDTFREFGAPTKLAIAEVIANNIPVFDKYRPEARKPWMSEDSRMGIFDAAALALTYFRCSTSGSNDDA